MMAIRCMRSAVLLSCACAVAPAGIGAQVHRVDTETVGAARSLAQTFMQTHTVPGLSIAVGRGSRVVWSEGFGYADLRDSTPVSPETQFRVGSISMALTAAGVGLLLERRQLSLGTPIRRYVPAFPHKRHDMAVGLVAVCSTVVGQRCKHRLPGSSATSARKRRKR